MWSKPTENRLATQRTPNTPVVAFKQVSKHYGDVVAACELELDVYAGEFLSLLGPSGCGKTTTLRMIAGFEQPTTGTVLLDSSNVNGVPAYQRPVNMVFQHYALFPHLNVAQNVAYGLKQRRPKPTRAVLKQRVAEMLDLVRLAGYQQRRVWELSGGQQQRIALARALINEPKVLLLDEPLAALDRKLRHEMQIELQTLQRNVGITFILVTHDQDEALSMSDRVCIMHDGRILQVGSPRTLYDKPVNRYVADFVGRSNFFAGSITAVRDDGIDILLTDNSPFFSSNLNNATSLRVGDKVDVCVRPEQLWLARARDNLPANQAFNSQGVVQNRIFLGEHTEYLLQSQTLGDILLLAPRQSELTELPLETGEVVHVSCGRDAALVLKAD